MVITGGATGIGAAMVAAFARQGCKVGFLDIDRAAGEALVETVNSNASSQLWFEPADLRDPLALEAALDKLASQHGDPDVLVNNAARDDRHELAAIGAEQWDELIAVNLRHYHLAARQVAPAMSRNRKGVIINLGSISWHLGLPNLSVYETAKAGAAGMTRGLARDLGPSGVRVVCLVPGAVRTERQMARWLTPDAETAIMAGQCLKDSVTPEIVAAAACFLASDDAAMCTGREFFVDAGWLA